MPPPLSALCCLQVAPGLALGCILSRSIFLFRGCHVTVPLLHFFLLVAVTPRTRQGSAMSKKNRTSDNSPYFCTRSFPRFLRAYLVGNIYRSARENECRSQRVVPDHVEQCNIFPDCNTHRFRILEDILYTRACSSKMKTCGKVHIKNRTRADYISGKYIYGLQQLSNSASAYIRSSGCPPQAKTEGK